MNRLSREAVLALQETTPDDDPQPDDDDVVGHGSSAYSILCAVDEF